jgi:DNA-binding MarR family transcriptional regulator
MSNAHELGPPMHVLAALERLNRRTDAFMRRSFPTEITGIRGSHGRILDLIDAQGSRPSELVNGSWITKQAMGQRLRELEDRGFVTIRPDPEDGRAQIVRRTTKGEGVRRAARTAIQAMEDEWAELVGADRYGEFRRVLDELGS